MCTACYPDTVFDLIYLLLNHVKHTFSGHTYSQLLSVYLPLSNFSLCFADLCLNSNRKGPALGVLSHSDSTEQHNGNEQGQQIRLYTCRNLR